MRITSRDGRLGKKAVGSRRREDRLGGAGLQL